MALPGTDIPFMIPIEQSIKAHLQPLLQKFVNLPIYTPHDNLPTINHTHISITLENTEPVHDDLSDLDKLNLSIETQISHSSPFFANRIEIYDTLIDALYTLTQTVSDIWEIYIGQHQRGIDSQDKNFTASIPLEIVYFKSTT